MTLASAERRLRHLFVRDLVLACRIGVEEAERRAPQRVRINLDLAVAEGDGPPDADDPARVVRCDDLLRRARAAATARPVRLMETLAERLAMVCLEDARVRAARVRVEKLDAPADAAAAGVEIERLNPAPPPPPAAA
ncbi:MAG TPA: dihydroneopterin aldolase [Geminicoccaceae bacterium]|nr:dihydroneopterin aldolase [Geminicoccaceae bacterium]